MHMADALISPAVAGTMYACTATAAAYSVKKVRIENNHEKVPVMGVMGAFVFASQMINFTIPGTGSSGHLCGGIMLMALLGPYGAFLAMISVLGIQALLFADGGLLALGCNIWNIGFYSCFLGAYMIWKPFMRGGFSRKKIAFASVLGSILTLQLGALSVTFETLASGITELPFGAFAAVMQPIHLAIGLVEGLITAAVLMFVYEARPEMLYGYDGRLPKAGEMSSGKANEAECDFTTKKGRLSYKTVLGVFIAAAVVAGGCFAFFASEYPDGLEWSIEKVAGTAELERVGGAYEGAKAVQQATALLPDYGFKDAGGSEATAAYGTGVSGIVGGAVVLGLSLAVGMLFKFFGRGRKKGNLATSPASGVAPSMDRISGIEPSSNISSTQKGVIFDHGDEGRYEDKGE